jgi:hypothetical protein
MTEDLPATAIAPSTPEAGGILTPANTLPSQPSWATVQGSHFPTASNERLDYIGERTQPMGVLAIASITGPVSNMPYFCTA